MTFKNLVIFYLRSFLVSKCLVSSYYVWSVLRNMVMVGLQSLLQQV